MALAKDLSTLPKPAPLKAEGWHPDPTPRFVHLLAEQWRADNDEAGPKARATATSRFRHSDAGKCARAIAFAALDLAPSDPMDLTGVWNTSLGTLIHDAWQQVIADRYPEARIEPKVTTIGGAGSGHIDAVVTTADKVIAFELKTIGGFAYKVAVGERCAAQGPKREHVIQAALNGKAVGAGEIVIGYLAKEAISVDAAKRKNIGELARFCAEWTLTADDYLPIAESEEARIAGILRLIDDGTLPARKIPSLELPPGAEIVDPATGRWEAHDPNGQILDTGKFWACGYCNYRTLCGQVPGGRQPITAVPVELRSAA